MRVPTPRRSTARSAPLSAASPSPRRVPRPRRAHSHPGAACRLRATGTSSSPMARGSTTTRHPGESSPAKSRSRMGASSRARSRFSLRPPAPPQLRRSASTQEVPSRGETRDVESSQCFGSRFAPGHLRLEAGRFVAHSVHQTGGTLAAELFGEDHATCAAPTASSRSTSLLPIIAVLLVACGGAGSSMDSSGGGTASSSASPAGGGTAGVGSTVGGGGPSTDDAGAGGLSLDDGGPVSPVHGDGGDAHQDAGTGEGGLDPNVAPGGNFDLSLWELQEPVGSPGAPTTILPAQLEGPNGYHDSYFFTDPVDGSMSFWDPENGVTTANSSYPRSELREMTASGAEANWTPPARTR